MEIIEIDQWARKEIYDLFSSKMNPFYTLSFNLDVTNVYGFAKQNGLSFYSCLAYLCTKALNSVDEFLLQIKDGKIVRFKERQPGLTMLDRETEVFRYVSAPADCSIAEFCRRIDEQNEKQKTLFGSGPADHDQMIHITCVPWIDMTAMTNQQDYSEESRNSSVPALCWGRYRDVDGRKVLVVTIEVNHRLVDGIHIGKFCANLEQYISELK